MVFEVEVNIDMLFTMFFEVEVHFDTIFTIHFEVLGTILGGILRWVNPTLRKGTLRGP